MSLKLQAIGTIPQQTVKVAEAAFPNGNTYITMRDELGVFFSDEQFAELFSSRGQPALSPWRLALVTIMQYAENLTDRQAAAAVRGRIDWKYALGLELTDPGFNYSVLSEFRDRLIEGSSEQSLLEEMLSCFTEKGLLKARGKQRTDSTHILAAIRTLNRLELTAETIIHTLNVLATVAPDWLKEWVPEEWFNRYERRLDEYRLPQEKKERTLFAETIGGDGYLLLSMIYSESAPEWLCSIPAVEIMRQIWVQHYYIEEGVVNWRTKGNIPPPAVMISSPHDVDVRFCTNKRDKTWEGYKVHLTETCDKNTPNLITSVQTTASTTSDSSVTEKVHKVVLTFPSSPLIGKTRKFSVHRARLVSIGKRPKDLAKRGFWRSLIKAIARFVPQKTCVPEAAYMDIGNSLFRFKKNIWLCKKAVDIRKHQNSKSVTLKEPVLRGRFLKPYMHLVCADAVIEA